jgi:hypothetical protein
MYETRRDDDVGSTFIEEIGCEKRMLSGEDRRLGVGSFYTLCDFLYWVEYRSPDFRSVSFANVLVFLFYTSWSYRNPTVNVN